MSSKKQSHAEAVAPRPDGGARPLEIAGEAEIQERYAVYLQDESRYGEPNAQRLYFPASEAQLSAVLREMNEARTPVTISAGRTGIVGGAVPSGGVLVSLERMKCLSGPLADESGRWLLTAGPAVTIEELVRHTEEENRRRQEGPELFYPPDPTETTAHLGGTVATNASGARSFRYGPTRSFVEGLRVVLATGDVLDLRRGEVTASDSGTFSIRLRDGTVLAVPVPELKQTAAKSTAGYYSGAGMDLVDLFIGSEGTLGVISEATVLLVEKPAALLSSVSFFPSEEKAVQFVRSLRLDSEPAGRSGLEPEAIEYFDGRSLDLLRAKRQEDGASSSLPELPEEARAAIFFEHAYTEESLDPLCEQLEDLLSSCGSSMDSSWGALDETELVKMKALRHGLPEAVNAIIGQRKSEDPAIYKVSTDMAVPDNQLERMLAFYHDRLEPCGLDFVIFGHIGDNHLHVNILPRSAGEMEQARELNTEFAGEAIRLGGTVAAEHGIGKIKRDLLAQMLGEEGIRQMQEVKRSLDPNWILNPGDILPDLR